MPVLARASLAARVCPTAPFLAPRLLRCPTRLAAAAPLCVAGRQRHAFATSARRTEEEKDEKTPAAAEAPQRMTRKEAAKEIMRGIEAARVRDGGAPTAEEAPRAKQAPRAKEAPRPKEAGKDRDGNDIVARGKTWKGKMKESRKETRKPLHPSVLAKITRGRDIQNEVALLEDFMKACASRDLARIWDLYPTAIECRMFNQSNMRVLSQALHNISRARTSNPNQDRPVHVFMNRLIQDIQTARVPPNPTAHVHILGMYKEAKLFDEGYQFWQWLSEQDDTHVSQAVYGAAIELLAYRGKSSLHELEELYMDGLKRFPATFAEYHLSPDAVVPDRTRAITIPGIPIAMLQGILTARLLARDWKNAYIALDIGLRLYPDTLPKRFFELFMYERPAAEAYSVFLLACRAGIVLGPKTVHALLAKKIKQDMFNFQSLSDRVKVLRALANALYAYQEAGADLDNALVGLFFNTFEVLLPPRPSYSGAEERIRNLMVSSAHEMAMPIAQIRQYPHIFVSLLNLAGKHKVRGLFDVIAQDIETAGIEIDHVGLRIQLLASGQFGDKQLVEKHWAKVVVHAEAQGTQLSQADWVTFARACRRSGLGALFQEQVQNLRHAIDQNTERAAFAELEVEETWPQFPYELMPEEELEKELKDIARIMTNVSAVLMAGQSLNLRQTPFDMFIDLNRQPLGPEEDLRAVYNELTTDPHQPAPAQDDSHAQPELSSTGIPLGELRFQNWVTVMELMADAEATEAFYQARLLRAASMSRHTDTVRPDFLRFTNKEAADHEARTTRSTPSLIEIKKRVKQLRAPYVHGPPATQIPQKKIRDEKTVPLRYFVGVESAHKQNIKPKISRNPLSSAETQGSEEPSATPKSATQTTA